MKTGIIIGYQVIDIEKVEFHPEMDASFCIYSRPQVEEMIENTNMVDNANFDPSKKWSILAIKENDIEQPTFMFEGNPETAIAIRPSSNWKEIMTRVVNEQNNAQDRDHDHAPEELNDEDVNQVFINKLEAFAKAAEELDCAWDYVDGNVNVMNALSKEWRFKDDLYYVALKGVSSWAKDTVKNLNKI